MKKLIVSAIIIGVLVVTGIVILNDRQIKQIRPFEGEPQHSIDILRQTPEIDQFYALYEKYGIDVVDTTEEQVRFVFSSSDGDNRIVNLDVRYYDGKPDDISHRCYEKEPKSRIFSEKSVTTNCFES